MKEVAKASKSIKVPEELSGCKKLPKKGVCGVKTVRYEFLSDL